MILQKILSKTKGNLSILQLSGYLGNILPLGRLTTVKI